MNKSNSGCFTHIVDLISGGVLILIFLIQCHGCASNRELTIQNPETSELEVVEFQPYGFLNKDELMNPQIKYELVVGNLVWSVLLSETIVAPILILGWYMYEPVGLKPTNIPHYKGAKDYTPVEPRKFQLQIDY